MYRGMLESCTSDGAKTARAVTRSLLERRRDTKYHPRFQTAAPLARWLSGLLGRSSEEGDPRGLTVGRRMRQVSSMWTASSRAALGC
jgi:hypothetical protein